LLLAGLYYTPTQWAFTLESYEHQQVGLYPTGRLPGGSLSGFEDDSLILFFDAYWPRRLNGEAKRPVLTVSEEDAAGAGRQGAVVLSTLPPPKQLDLSLLWDAQGTCFDIPDAPYPAINPAGTYYDSPFGTGCRATSAGSPLKIMAIKDPQLVRGVDTTASGIKSEAYDKVLRDWFTVTDEDVTPLPTVVGRIGVTPRDLTMTVGVHVNPAIMGPLDVLQGGVDVRQPAAQVVDGRVELTRLHTFDDDVLGVDSGDHVPLVGAKIVLGPNRVVLLSPVVPDVTYSGGGRWGFDVGPIDFDFLTNPDRKPVSVTLFDEPDGGVGTEIVTGPLDFTLGLTGVGNGTYTVVVVMTDPADPDRGARLVFRDVPVTVGERFSVTFDEAALTTQMVRESTGQVLVGVEDPCQDDPLGDFDRDAACDSVDNCQFLANADQADADADGTGDACDDATSTTTLPPGSTTTTFTPVSTTTTTTLPPACASAPTHESILCRLASLRADVSSSKLGGAITRLLKGLDQAAQTTSASQAAVGTGKTPQGKRALKGATRKMAAVVKQLEKGKVRKADPTAAAGFSTRAGAILADVRTLRRTL
jgi:hypothetical protein